MSLSQTNLIQKHWKKVKINSNTPLKNSIFLQEIV